ncbi:MAG: T9SS type A sorting domain-containing protein, partial [Fibrobacteres bacterium]|nr:T9SS type A sorting domain-containing protein [Fibrobacterota bacterium]
YVLAAEWFRGTGTKMVVFSREGNYLRTIAPYPGNIPEERLKGFGRLTQPDGKKSPVVFQGMDGSFLPEFFNPHAHTMAVTSNGWIVFSNSLATGSWYGVQTNQRRAMIIGTDGSCPRDTVFGPVFETEPWAGSLNLAVTPDNKYVYGAGPGKYKYGEPQVSRHVVYRSKLDTMGKAEIFLGTPDVPGSGTGELNDPQGVAVDNNGNLYVADHGNSRVSIFNSNGTLIKSVSVWRPRHIQINRKTGEFFVLSYSMDTLNPVVITKFSTLPAPVFITEKRFTRISTTSTIPVFTLDYFADTAIVWIGSLDYLESTIHGFFDLGDTLVPNPVKIAKRQPDYWAGSKLYGPGYMAISPDESFLYAGCDVWAKLDLNTGAITQTKIRGNELIFAPDTTVYAYSGGGYKDSLAYRYSKEGVRIPFANGANFLNFGPTEFYGPSVGAKGLAILSNGNLVIPNTGWTRSDTIKYSVWDLKSCTKVKTLPIEMPHSAAGFAADRQGNLYFACNVRPKGVAYPEGMRGEFLPDPLASNSFNYPYAFLNYYLFGVGCIIKFPQTAKGIHEHASNISAVPFGTLDDSAIPTDQVNGIYKSHYKVEGAIWQHLGISHCPSPWRGRGDQGCFCFTPRFSVDGHGRIIYPDAYRFNVVVMDNNKNELLRFGEYGNRDQQGKFSAVPSPDIPLTYPMYVEKMKNSLYITDMGSRRITKVKLRYRTWATSDDPVSIEDTPIPASTDVFAYPMPFNPSVNIEIHLVAPSNVTLTVFNTQGRIVKHITSSKLRAGVTRFVWDGRDAHNNSSAAGLYYAKIQIGKNLINKKLMLVK